jgi:hypothetical protein
MIRRRPLLHQGIERNDVETTEYANQQQVHADPPVGATEEEIERTDIDAGTGG